jgi:hypothetical protein
LKNTDDNCAYEDSTGVSQRFLSRWNLLYSRVPLRWRRGILLLVSCTLPISWLLTFPTPLWNAGAGGDQSWVLALHLAWARGLVFGKDIVFTYGPLGYLDYPLYVDHWLWLTSVAFRIVVHTAFYAALGAFALKSNNRAFNILLISFSAGIVEALYFDVYLLPATVLILSYLAVCNPKTVHYLPLLSILAAIPVYVKYDAGLLSLATMVLTASWLALRRRYLISLAMLAAYVASLMLIGVLILRYTPQELLLYFYRAAPIVLGYGDAMSIDGPALEIAIAAISGVAVGFLALHELLRRRPSPIFFLSLGFLFVTFKIGFVRQDLHVVIFFAGWALFLILYQATVSKAAAPKKENLRVWIISFLFIFILLISGMSLFGFSSAVQDAYGTTNVLNLTNTVQLLSNPQMASLEFTNSVQAVRTEYALSPAVLARLSNHTVDVFPWDVALVYAYDLEWDPRPVFQSYVAYTATLDALNAEHFNSGAAPDIVIFRPESIDGRYPLFDEPATLRSLLCNYSLEALQWPFFILSKGHDRCGSPVPLLTLEAAFGKSISVPFLSKGYIFATVQMTHTVLGALENVAYKGPHVYVRLDFIDGSSQSFRFIPDPAKNGIFLSATPNYRLFGDKIAPFVKAMTFFTDGEGSFENSIRVSFFDVPLQNGQTSDYAPVKSWEGLTSIPGGLGWFDGVNGHAAEGVPIHINESSVSAVTVEGWAVDELSQGPADQVYLLLDGKVEGVAYYGYVRPDVAEQYDNYRYLFSGWKISIPSSNVALGCHELAVRVLTANHYYTIASATDLCIDSQVSQAARADSSVGSSSQVSYEEVGLGRVQSSMLCDPARELSTCDHWSKLTLL